MSFYFLEIFRIRKMNFQVGADNEITMTSTEMDGGEKKTTIRTATWNPKNGGFMTMVQVGLRSSQLKITAFQGHYNELISI